MNKISTLAFILTLLVSSVIIVESVTAQSASKPSVPEFTLQYIDRSYEKPPTYETDPLTGQTVIKESGYHVTNRNVDVSIKNQPFTPYLDSSGNYTKSHYNVRFKGHYEEQWKNIQDPKYWGYYNISQSDYTVITIKLESFFGNSLETGGQLDVQVETLIGNDFRIPTMTPWGESCYYEFSGQSSGFSDIHTIDLISNTVTVIPNTSTSPSYTLQASKPSSTENPTPTPTVPEFPVLVILPLFVAISLIATVLLRKKRS